MDNTLTYQQCITALLAEYQAYLGGANLQQTDERLKVIIDTEHHHYQLLIVGWKAGKYRFKVLFHLDIIANKIWIQQNDTEFSIADELMEKGVLQQDIVLGFLSERDRAYSGFAST